MIDTARNTADDPAARYVLLRVARDIGVQAGDIEVATTAVSEMAAHYDVDGTQMEFDVLAKISADSQPRTAREALLSRLRVLHDKALVGEQYGIAEKVASLGTETATSLRDVETARTWEMRHQRAQQLKEQFSHVQEAMAALDKDPVSPDANLTVGKYRCFTRGDWRTGLPLLALGADAQLKRVAQKELREDPVAKDAVELGDAWWSLATTREGNDGVAMKRRAAYWYDQALPSQTGLTKVRLQKRLKEAALLSSSPLMGSPGSSSVTSAEQLLSRLVETLRRAKPVNLGRTVNSSGDDKSPALSADGLTLLFSSTRPGGMGKLDLWTSVRASVHQPFGRPVNLGRIVNSENWDSGPELSSDGQLLLFGGERPGGLGKADLWMCKWSVMKKPIGVPVNLGRPINTGHREASSTLSSDGRTLIFSSDRSGGLGGLDLWISKRASLNEPFGQPVNLGSTVNSNAGDGSPALSADGRVLLFSSSRPGGIGDGDLWMCARPDSNQLFGPPINLGPSINTKACESSPAISADGRLLVFSSSRAGGYGDHDLWMAQLDPPAAAPQTTAVQPPVIAPTKKNDTGPPADAITYNGHHYKVFWRRLSWPEAKRACEEKGGYLACLETREEQQLLARLKGENRAVWVGGFREDARRWCWVNGVEMPEERLLSVNLRKDRTCAAFMYGRSLNGRPPHGREPAYRIDMIQGFICEWD
jgi:hypothetical protein